MEKQELFLFLNAIGLSSRQILSLYEILEKRNLPWEDGCSDIFLESIQFPKSARERISKNYSRISQILEKIKEYMEKRQVRALFIFEENFPNRLREIENPPALLFLKGRDLHIKNAVAVVGARKHSAYGELVVKRLIEELSPYDCTIVSGLAYGIDAHSHKRALDRDMKTVGVLGTGIDVVYPKANESLYREILERGTLVSEFAFGSGPHSFHFPLRNRIISGLSQAVVVIEAQEKSGSLITARLAAEQGREVYAVPGNINSIFSAGTNRLIRDGARPFLEIEDLLDAFAQLKITNPVKIAQERLTSEEEVVYNLIEVGCRNANEICNSCNFEISYINSILTILELKGRIVKTSGNEFEIL